jgi:hypothetical protein
VGSLNNHNLYMVLHIYQYESTAYLLPSSHCFWVCVHVASINVLTSDSQLVHSVYHHYTPYFSEFSVRNVSARGTIGQFLCWTQRWDGLSTQSYKGSLRYVVSVMQILRLASLRCLTNSPYRYRDWLLLEMSLLLYVQQLQIRCMQNDPCDPAG